MVTGLYDPLDGLPDYNPADIEALDAIRDKYKLHEDIAKRLGKVSGVDEEKLGYTAVSNMFKRFCTEDKPERVGQRRILYHLDGRLQGKSFSQIREEKEFERTRKLEQSEAEKELERLRTDHSVLQSSNNSFASTKERLQTENDRLDKKVEQAKGIIAVLRREVLQNRVGISALESSITRLEDAIKAKEEELVKEREKTGKSAKRKDRIDWTKSFVTLVIAGLSLWVAYLMYQLKQRDTLQSTPSPTTQSQQIESTSPTIGDSVSSLVPSHPYTNVAKSLDTDKVKKADSANIVRNAPKQK